MTPRATFRALALEIVGAPDGGGRIERALPVERNIESRLSIPLPAGAGTGTAWTVRVRGVTERGFPVERARGVRIPLPGGRDRYEEAGAGPSGAPVRVDGPGGTKLLLFTGRKR